jgi:hypothetical protein
MAALAHQSPTTYSPSLTNKIVFDADALIDRETIAKQIQAGKIAVELLFPGQLYIYNANGSNFTHAERAEMLKLFFKNL